MLEQTNATASPSDSWYTICKDYRLKPEQIVQFDRYMALLQGWNMRMNLTRISDAEDIYHYHFLDSLKVSEVIDFSTIKTIADVGTGGGVPGIPLKILYPHLKVILIEVCQKKILFLETVINELGLTNIEVSSLDWRTFLRTTHEPIEIFLARASLRPDELARMFKADCSYQDAKCIYFASEGYTLDKRFEHLLAAEAPYMVGNKARRFLLLAMH